KSLEKEAKPGKYEAKIAELRAANEKDKARVAAYKARNEAELLKADGKPESIKQAIAKYEEAISLFETAGDSANELAYTLSYLAQLYQIRGDYNRAEPLYQRALAVWEKA